MAKLTVEPTGRTRQFRYWLPSSKGQGKPLAASAAVWRVNVAGVKGSLAVAGRLLWVERHSGIGKRLQRNLHECQAIMAKLPAGDTYEWIWF